MQILNRVRLYRRRQSAPASRAYYWLVVANRCREYRAGAVSPGLRLWRC